MSGKNYISSPEWHAYMDKVATQPRLDLFRAAALQGLVMRAPSLASVDGLAADAERIARAMMAHAEGKEAGK